MFTILEGFLWGGVQPQNWGAPAYPHMVRVLIQVTILVHLHVVSWRHYECGPWDQHINKRVHSLKLT